MLTVAQRAQVPTVRAKDAEAYEYSNEVWTTKRVADLVQREFSVHRHPAHGSRTLRAISWRMQQPVPARQPAPWRASQRHEAAIAQWRDERRPTLEAKPKRRGGR